MSSRDLSGADRFDDAVEPGLDADELAEQRAVRELLSSLPDPGPVPPDVVDRITQTLRALQAEEASRAAGPGTVRHANFGTSAPRRLGGGTAADAPHRARPRVLWLAAAAAIALVGGGAVVSQLGSDSSSSDTSASVATRTAGGAAPVGARVLATGTNYTRADLAAQALTLLAAQRAAAAQGSRASSPPAPGGAPSPSPALPAVPSPAGSSVRSTEPSVPSPVLPGAAAPWTVAGCLRLLHLQPAALVAADRATYEGRPALVLVVTAAARREVRVVDLACRPLATARVR